MTWTFREKLRRVCDAWMWGWRSVPAIEKHIAAGHDGYHADCEICLSPTEKTP